MEKQNFEKIKKKERNTMNSGKLKMNSRKVC